MDTANPDCDRYGVIRHDQCYICGCHYAYCEDEACCPTVWCYESIVHFPLVCVRCCIDCECCQDADWLWCLIPDWMGYGPAEVRGYSELEANQGTLL